MPVPNPLLLALIWTVFSSASPVETYVSTSETLTKPLLPRMAFNLSGRQAQLFDAMEPVQNGVHLSTVLLPQQT